MSVFATSIVEDKKKSNSTRKPRTFLAYDYGCSERKKNLGLLILDRRKDPGAPKTQNWRKFVIAQASVLQGELGGKFAGYH